MADPIPDTPFQLRWRRTWPDVGEDFVARDSDDAYCRIYLSTSQTTDGAWFWTANRVAGKLGSGYASTARDAARKAEECFLGTAALS